MSHACALEIILEGIVGTGPSSHGAHPCSGGSKLSAPPTPPSPHPQTYTTLLVCTPFWYLLRVLVMRWAGKQTASSSSLPPPQQAQNGSARHKEFYELGESKASFKTTSSSENSGGILAPHA